MKILLCLIISGCAVVQADKPLAGMCALSHVGATEQGHQVVRYHCQSD